MGAQLAIQGDLKKALTDGAKKISTMSSAPDAQRALEVADGLAEVAQRAIDQLIDIHGTVERARCLDDSRSLGDRVFDLYNKWFNASATRYELTRERDQLQYEIYRRNITAIEASAKALREETERADRAATPAPEERNDPDQGSPRFHYMDIREFVQIGCLQEINRRFLYPLGLALEVTTWREKPWILSGIRDYLNDPEGLASEWREEVAHKRRALLSATRNKEGG